MKRLDIIAPGLVKRLETVPLGEMHSRLARACEIAGRSVFDIEVELKTWINDCVNRGYLTASQITAARAFAGSADENYFTIRESGGDEKLWTNWFRKARLASAIVYAFGGKGGDDAFQAAYELCHSVDNEEAQDRIIKMMDPEYSARIRASHKRSPSSKSRETSINRAGALRKLGKNITRLILPAKFDSAVNKRLVRQWQERLRQYEKCKTKAEIEGKFGCPSREYQQGKLEIWIYDLGLHKNNIYSIRVAFMNNYLKQAYLGIERPE